MATKCDSPKAAEAIPYLENLEPRLLLTTLHGGEFFIYHNSQGDTIRVDLEGEPDDTVELLAHHALFGIVDLPGYGPYIETNYYPYVLPPPPPIPALPLDESHMVGWPGVDEPLANRIYSDDKTTSWLVWNEQGDMWETPDGVQLQTRYGARCEIYAAYVVQCSADTRLVATRLNLLNTDDPAYTPDQPYFAAGWYNLIDPWGGQVPTVFCVGDTPDATTQVMPESGAVLIGAFHNPPPGGNGMAPIWAGALGGGDSVADVPVTGVYPGSPPYGLLYAGVTISDEFFRMASADALGRNVGAVAADVDGNAYAVDNSPFIADLINRKLSGDLGQDVQSLAVNTMGDLYSVDNGRQMSLVDTGTNQNGTPIPIALNAHALTIWEDVHNSYFLTIDEDTHQVKVFPRPPNTGNGGFLSIGAVASPTGGQVWQGFVSLATDPESTLDQGTIWGLAQLGTDPALYLVRTTMTAVAVRQQVVFDQVAKLQVDPNAPPKWSAVPGIRAMAMYSDPVNGTTIVAVTQGNQLVTIDRMTGMVSLMGVADALRTVNDKPVATITGLEYIGQTLYGISSDRRLYRIDTTLIGTGPRVCTDLGDSYAPFADSLAYDPGRPARFYALVTSESVLRVGEICIGSAMLQISGAGTATVSGPLYDAAHETIGYQDVTAMDAFDEGLYAVARVLDLDPVGPLDPSESLWLIQVDGATGETTRIGQISGPKQLSAAAYDPVAGLFCAVDPVTNRLFKIDVYAVEEGDPDTDLDDSFDLTGQQRIDVGNGPEDLLYVDVNDDGYGDALVLCHDIGEVQVLLNDGHGNFAAPVGYAVGAGPVAMITGLVDGNASPDIVVVNEDDDSVSILLNNGDGTFGAQSATAVGGAPRGVVLGDVDDDGFNDLLVANSGDNTVSVLLGNGDGTFSPAPVPTVRTQLAPQAVALADMDGDGALDLIVANGDSDTVSVYMGRGDGTFMEDEQYAPAGVAVGDIDNDGNLDVVTANLNGDTISVLLGNGDGTFHGRWTYDVGDEPVGVILTDLNGDGNLDAVAANRTAGAAGTVSVLLGNGDGTFAPQTTYAVGAGPNSVTAGLLNGDANADLVVTNYADDTVSVLLGNGDGTFGAQTAYAVGDSPSGAILGNYNSDGLNALDIVTVNRMSDNVSVLLGNGDGTFQAQTTQVVWPGATPPQNSFAPVAIAGGDLDGDGLRDVVVANQNNNTVSVLLGKGNGGFVVQATLAVAQRGGAVKLADVNKDNLLDILVTSVVDGRVSVLLNSGAGAFATAVNYAVGAQPSALAVGDFANQAGPADDGVVDIVVANQASDTVSLLLANGNGTFQPSTAWFLGNTFAVGELPYDLLVSDVNGDGAPDVIVAERDAGSVSVLLGDGRGLLGAPTTYSVGVEPSDLAMGDLNGDGKADLFVALTGSNAVAFLPGNGTGTFGTVELYPTGEGASAVAVGNVNGTGGLDVLATNSGEDTLSVLLGNGDGSFGGIATISGNAAPLVGIQFVEMGGQYTFMGVSADTLYSIDPDTLVCTELGAVTRYHQDMAAAPTRLTSLTYDAAPLMYDPDRLGFLWAVDDYSYFYYLDKNGDQVLVDEAQVTWTDGRPYLDKQVLIHVQDFRLTRIRLSSSLMRIQTRRDPTTVALRTLGKLEMIGQLFDADEAAHPFWYYDGVQALDFSPDGVMYAVATVHTLDAGLDPVAAEAQWLITITPPHEQFYNVVTDYTRLVRRVMPVSETFTTLMFGEDGTLYGYTDMGELVYFEQVAGSFTGNVIPVTWSVEDIVGMAMQNDYVSYLAGYGDGAFGAQTSFGVGEGPHLAPFADLNDDGHPDFVTANEYRNTVSLVVSEEQPDGSVEYLPQVTYPVGERPTAAAMADFNRDGYTDVVVADGDDNNVMILWGNGDGTLQAGTLEPFGLTVGDVNGDGHPDLVTTNWMPWDSAVTVFTNDGAGHFQATAWHAVGLFPIAATVADVTGDGINDIVAVNYGDDTISVLAGTGGGYFLPQVTYAVGLYPVCVQATDVDGDGLLDVVAVNSGSNNVSVLLQQGDGTLGEPTNYNVGDMPTWLVVADVNNDGRDDLIVSNDGSNNVSVLLAVGNGTYRNAVAYAAGTEPSSVDVGDFNNDGNLDLVVANLYGLNVSVLLGNGNGTFQAQVTYDVGLLPVAVHAGDLDGDGNVDIVATNQADDDVSVLMGLGDGTFVTPAPTYTVAGVPTASILADLNGDGILDVAAASNLEDQVSVLIGAGDGTFFAHVDYDDTIVGALLPVGANPVDLIAADVNRDGFPDIVTADYDSATISVLLNDGVTGYVWTLDTYAMGGGPVALALGDIDSNGTVDIVAARPDDDVITILLGDGFGNFTVSSTITVGDDPADVALADLDGDGFLDIVTADEGDNALTALFGTGEGAFVRRQVLAMGYPVNSVVLGDLDGDGAVDIVAGSESASLAFVMRGTGNGTFLGRVVYDMPYGPRTLRLGDLDGDGFVDIAAAHRDRRMFAATAGDLYDLTIAEDRSSATLTLIGSGLLSGTFTGLGSESLDPRFQWGVAQFGAEGLENYYLVKVFTGDRVQDMGRVIVGGTVAGAVISPGNIDAIELGFLWGDVMAGRNLNNLILHQGSALDEALTGYAYTANIDVQGTLNSIEVLAGHFASYVDVHNNPEIRPLKRIITRADTNVPAGSRAGWLGGGVLRYLDGNYDTWTDNGMANGTYINHPSGSAIVEGTLAGADTLPEEIPDLGAGWVVDWYSFAMDAGQTVTIQGFIKVLGELYPLIYYGITANPLMAPKLHLFDDEGNWMDSCGYETMDDYGVGSMYRFDSDELIDEQKPIAFTAPKAGLYHLAVVAGTAGWNYHIEMSGLMPSALGAIMVDGDLCGGINSQIPVDDQGRALSETYDDVVVRNGGNIGALVAKGTMGLVSLDAYLPVSVHTIGGGSIGVVEAGDTPDLTEGLGVTVLSEGSIGRLASTEGNLYVDARAGYTGLDPATQLPYPAPLDWDAHITTVTAATDLSGYYVASGSMGTFRVGGSVTSLPPPYQTTFEVNYDEAGPPGRLDLIDVDGDWGSGGGVPSLMRHRDGDIGYILVDGDIWGLTAWGFDRVDTHRFEPDPVTGAVAASTIYDDSGGKITIQPVTEPQVDANGNPVYQTVNGVQVPLYVTPSYEYVIIGVDDFDHPTSGDGGVIANLRTTGTLQIQVTGEAKISRLELDTEGAPNALREINISGAGRLGIYDAEAAQDWNAITWSGVSSGGTGKGQAAAPTRGNLVTGSFQNIDRLLVGGNVGSVIGTLGEWLWGQPDAPVSGDLQTEPQYGWLDDKINGLAIDGDIQELAALGHVRDLRVTGTIGKVVANADGQTAINAWDGICGLIWSATRIESVAVGDGLADDGPVGKAKAGIMCSWSIGEVTITGPRYVRNGVVFGEINGSILGYSNDTVTVTNADGTTSTVERLAVGKVTGTGGAQFTAMVGGMSLDTFYCFDMEILVLQPRAGGGGGALIYTGVGDINFSGAHARIYGAEIMGNYVVSVVATAESDGMSDTRIFGSTAKPNGLAVGTVAAGGPGMTHVSVSADGGDVGTIAGLAPQSDFYYCDFIVTDGGIQSIRARDIVESCISAPEDVGTIAVGRDVINLARDDGQPGYALWLPNLYGDGDVQTAQQIVSDDTISYQLTWPQAVAVADLNLDGVMDLVTTNHCNDYHIVVVQYGIDMGFPGEVYFPWPPLIYRVEAEPSDLAVADLNSDGWPDIITSNFKLGRISILLNQLGDQQATDDFAPERIYEAGQGSVALTVGLVNDDLIPDIVVANKLSNDVTVFLGRGNGTMRLPRTYAVGSAPLGVTLADVDGDGHNDIITANSLDDTISILPGNGNGTFRPQTTLAVGKHPSDVAAGDLNGDGWADLVVANQYEPRASVLLNNGDGTFAEQRKEPIGHGARSVTLGDINGDGALDIAAANESDDTVSILLGNGDGTFQEQEIHDAPVSPVDVVLADLDGDGTTDVVTANRSPIEPGLLIGAVSNFTVGRHVLESYFKIAGDVRRMTVGGVFDSTELLLPGSAGNLKYFEVNGDISGLIESHGAIGSVISKTGGIYADVLTTYDGDAPSNNVGLIRTFAGFTGRLEVAGSLGTFECYTDLGNDPRLGGEHQSFHILGNLGKLTVKSKAGPANLYADVHVGGSAGTIDIGGTLFSEINVHGDLKTFNLAGNLGYRDPLGGAEYGTVDVLGTIGNLKFSSNGDLVADIRSGGTVKKITVKGGSIYGDIVSRYGNVEGVTVTDGDILGSIIGEAIKSVTVKNGNIGYVPDEQRTMPISVMATNGGIDKLSVTGGNLLANVLAVNGGIKGLNVKDGQLGSGSHKFVVRSTNAIGKLSVSAGKVGPANVYADVEAGGRIDKFDIKNGSLINALVSAGSVLGSLNVAGDVTGSVVRAGVDIGSVAVKGSNVTGSVISAGRNIGTLGIDGDATGSYILAGFDVGTDGVTVLTGDGTGAFRPDTWYTVVDGQYVKVNGPQAAVLADLDGVAGLDLAIANADGNTVLVLPGNNDGTFDAYNHGVYEVGEAPAAIAAGDLNNDGKTDLVVANSAANTISVLLGNGLGTFGGSVDFAVGNAPVSVALGDVTGDGLLDAVVANSGGNNVTVLPGDGLGGFGAGATWLVGDSPQCVVLADMDGDADLDMVVANEGNDSVTIRLNNGTGSFTNRTNYDAGDAPVFLAVGDLDGTAQLDIVVANRRADNVMVLLSNGAGGYVEDTDGDGDNLYPTGDGPVFVALQDITGDGQLDLVVLNAGDETLSVRAGNGDGTFGDRELTPVGHSPAFAAFGDLNADGKTDIVVVNRSGGDNPLAGGHVHSGNIGTAAIKGTFDTSVLSAGVGPGDDGDFTTMGDNTEAPGVSRIGKLQIGAIANANRSAVLADTGIDTKFLDAVAGSPLNVTTNFITRVENGAGTDFTTTYTGTGVHTGLTAKLSGTNARANFAFDGATVTITLEQTDAKSKLSIQWKGAGPYPYPIDVIGSEDGGMSALSVTGDVTVRDMDVDGDVSSIKVGQVAPGAVWDLPGAMASVSIASAADLDLDVTAAALKGFATGGAYVAGGFRADELGGFTTKGATGADVTVTHGAVKKLSVGGDYTGDMWVFNDAQTLQFNGAFSGSLTVAQGDVKTLKIGGPFTGRAELQRGLAGKVTIAGDFGQDPDAVVDDQTSFRAACGITGLAVSGSLWGLVSTDGDFGILSVSDEFGGKVRAGRNMKSASFGSMDRAFLSAGNNLDSVSIKGFWGVDRNDIPTWYEGMTASSIYAGFDPGDAGYDPENAGERYNIALDAGRFTPPGNRTPQNADEPRGGSIKTVSIRGDFGPAYYPLIGGGTFLGPSSTISAALAPGRDGYAGTYDDEVRGTGSVGKVTISGGVYGSGIASESYGVFAANSMPTVYFHGSRQFHQNDNVGVGMAPAAVGLLLVDEVTPQFQKLIVTFNHALNMGTINTAQRDSTWMTTFHVYASHSPFLDLDGDGRYEYTGLEPDLADIAPNTITWNARYHTLTLTLGGTGSWSKRAEGPYFLLVIDGGVVADPYGTLLDGDNDLNPGGDFQFAFSAPGI